ncbi:hypothetical protein GSI_08434 [Ganoderma sinense ZZ0214-1]|uniref:Uncharacterized protein n=1 Tax=Ganoderma sinense ZZ0214-1 TaxID=1077348 RepID=A0A2G8S6T9_9APHY|nr:hypothetical protein GSI_08434 [Ganoderma sinense ZZ0214-1]
MLMLTLTSITGDGSDPPPTTGDAVMLMLPVLELPVNIALSVSSFFFCRTRSVSSAPPVIRSFFPATNPVSSVWNSSDRLASSRSLFFSFASIAFSRFCGSTAALRISISTELMPPADSSRGGGRNDGPRRLLDVDPRSEITFSTCPNTSTTALWSSNRSSRNSSWCCRNCCSSTMFCSSSSHVFFHIGLTVWMWSRRLCSSASAASMSPLTFFSRNAFGDTFRFSTSSLMPSTVSCSSSIFVSTFDDRVSSFVLPVSMYARAPPTFCVDSCLTVWVCCRSVPSDSFVCFMNSVYSCRMMPRSRRKF